MAPDHIPTLAEQARAIAAALAAERDRCVKLGERANKSRLIFAALPHGAANALSSAVIARCLPIPLTSRRVAAVLSDLHTRDARVCRHGRASSYRYYLQE